MPRRGPTEPGRTTFANPRATPPTCAVPQSGPMTSTSAAAAASLSRTSSSTDTLSENSITDIPDAMASKASVTACCPGTEMRASVAPSRAAADPSVRGATASSPPPESVVARRAARASATAARPGSTASAVSVRSATTRSLGPASSGTSKPMPRSTSTLSSVAIATWAADDARRGGDGAGDLHEAHRVVVGTSAQLDVGGHAALRPVGVRAVVGAGAGRPTGIGAAPRRGEGGEGGGDAGHEVATRRVAEGEDGGQRGLDARAVARERGVDECDDVAGGEPVGGRVEERGGDGGGRAEPGPDRAGQRCGGAEGVGDEQGTGEGVVARRGEARPAAEQGRDPTCHGIRPPR